MSSMQINSRAKWELPILCHGQIGSSFFSLSGSDSVRYKDKLIEIIITCILWPVFVLLLSKISYAKVTSMLTLATTSLFKKHEFSPVPDWWTQNPQQFDTFAQVGAHVLHFFWHAHCGACPVPSLRKYNFTLLSTCNPSSLLPLHPTVHRPAPSL
jgi:hypothetical protein